MTEQQIEALEKITPAQWELLVWLTERECLAAITDLIAERRAFIEVLTKIKALCEIQPNGKKDYFGGSE